MFTLLFFYMYVIGGVVAGRASYADEADKVMAIFAAICWPAAPTLWLYKYLKSKVD